jgi:hypothetical protein
MKWIVTGVLTFCVCVIVLAIGLVLFPDQLGVPKSTKVDKPHGMYNTPSGYAPTNEWDNIFKG